jgi:hypothetical protein
MQPMLHGHQSLRFRADMLLQLTVGGERPPWSGDSRASKACFWPVRDRQQACFRLQSKITACQAEPNSYNVTLSTS